MVLKFSVGVITCITLVLIGLLHIEYMHRDIQVTSFCTGDAFAAETDADNKVCSWKAATHDYVAVSCNQIAPTTDGQY